MAETVIERAARALYRARAERQHPKPDNHPWEALSRREQALLRVDCRAVLAAIREPSEEMVAMARWGTAGGTLSQEAAVRMNWQEMIDAALAEEG